jgi:hypothetical protein
MSKPIQKTQIILEGNKLLGSLLYFQDSKGRPCLKLSFKNKIAPAKLWAIDKSTGAKKDLKDTPDEHSLDISYKFTDSVLEIKSEIPGTKPSGTFIDVPLPPLSYLFLIRIKDWHDLSEVIPEKNHLLLTPPTNASQIAVFFSFTGTDGKPFLDPEYNTEFGRTIIFNIPHPAPLDKLWIGIVEDKEHNEPYNLLIKVAKFKKILPV